MTIKAGIIGGTGYTGVELLRLLAQHPKVELAAITSRSEAGKPVASLFPNLRGVVDIAFSDPEHAHLQDCDVVFSATPNGIAMHHAQELVAGGARLIDLAADFRFRDLGVWQQYYQMEHACADLAAEAVYGLPEYAKEHIRSARIVGNPGCYPTAVQLGILPLLEADVIEPEIIADCKSGVSGAGRGANVATLQAESAENFKAYGVFSHRHQPEIVENLGRISGKNVAVTFVPHLLPMIRGIQATLYVRLTRETDLQNIFETRYADATFVDVLPPKTCPETRWVRGANGCKIGVFQQGNTGIILSVIDNLVKGASGQAVQNMNIMFGLAEDTGLRQVAMMP
jgi:N-acetyl-gamma-glutamyl-phosphate reductase